MQSCENVVGGHEVCRAASSALYLREGFNTVECKSSDLITLVGVAKDEVSLAALLRAVRTV